MSISPGVARKLRGGYYTPQEVAEWLARWAIRSDADAILEPSCGDGVFLAAAVSQLRRHRTLLTTGQLPLGIELQKEEAESAKERLESKAEVLACDFFDWLDRTERNFDVVLGNPPFIRYQNFPEPSRSQAIQFMQSLGLEPNRLTNIWVPFVVAATHLLREDGRLAMVLPAELLQVTYAAQLRQYLADSFRRITIYACNEMFFQNAEQEVVLLLAEGKLKSPDPQNRCDIDLIGSDTVSALLDQPAKTKRPRANVKLVQHETEKWLKFFLNAREIEFMRSLRQHPEVGTLSEHAQVDVGVVTGRNEFFIVSQDEVEQHELHAFVAPLVGRSAQLPGAVIRRRDHQEMARDGKRVFLIHLKEHDEGVFTPGLRSLIAHGERKGIHRGYKCSIRNPWYEVPSVWFPDCFFFRQIYDFPRVVVNRAKATSTDTIHRMRCQTSTARVAASLYTHLTAASAEIEGRSYGGGVLELEPTEAERLLVPKRLNGAMPIEEADKLIRRGQLVDVLDHNDQVILRQTIGMTQSECRLLKAVWAKMRDRRLARRRR